MTTRASSRTRWSSVWMWMAGVTSQRPRTTRASLSTTQMSEAVSSCHHSPHGLTNMSVWPSSCQVMCPAIFSANSVAARWRKAMASACSLVKSTPIGGTTDGAQTSRPPRRALGAFMIGLHPYSNILAELAFGDLAPRRSGKMVDNDESFGQQFLGDSQRQQVLDEPGQVDGLRVDEFGVEADLFTEHRVGHRDRRGYRDSGVGRDGVLDLCCTDVLAAAQDEIGGSAGDGEIAVRVDLADVAHAHPPVGGE